jgi:FMN reductase
LSFEPAGVTAGLGSGKAVSLRTKRAMPYKPRREMLKRRPLIIGIGGTTRPNSSSEAALRLALDYAAESGAGVEAVCGPSLNLPMYDVADLQRDANASRLVELLRRADGIILSTPSYHGSFSGMVKNALDYAEDLRSDGRPYLEGRVVGMIVCAYGWQATGTTLSALRSVVHALRGWPTPFGVSINSSITKFSSSGSCEDENVALNLRVMSQQVVEFSMRSHAAAV